MHGLHYQEHRIWKPGGSHCCSTYCQTTLQRALLRRPPEPHAADPTSPELQNRFADAVPTVVVGRDIDEIKVDRIAGSSATPNGFNAALERIKAKATKDGTQ